MRRLALGTALAGLLLSALAPAASAAPDRERWDTRVFSLVPAPGFPAYAFVHPNRRVYAGTYSNPLGDSQRSRVFEWSRDGALLRSWTVPGQDLEAAHGVQVANADAKGRLVLLEKSRARVMTLNVETGKFRRWATIPDLPDVEGSPIPNYATWGPRGALYVTDYGQAVVWKIPRKTQEPKAWFVSDALAGAAGFGTTGIVYRHATRDLLITQQTVSDGSDLPTNGKLYRLPITDTGAPGELETVWTSLPTDLPDGFGIARSGNIYVANAGLTAQIVVLSPEGEELERFPETPGTGENGSPVPFDTPSNATFHGTRVLVANQSFTGDSSHHAILDVEVGERGVTPYLPRRAFWR
jgi:sugar lactone lactonase YvrE